MARSSPTERRGQYINPDEVKEPNHKGQFFQVKGPLNIRRCPQGQPIILQAGSSEPGLAPAACTADMVFSVVQELDEAKLAYREMKDLLPKYGRVESDIALLPGVMPVIGATEAEAREKLNTLQGCVTSSDAATLLSQRLGVDVSGYPLDEPVPDLPSPTTRTASPAPCWPRPSARG